MSLQSHSYERCRAFIDSNFVQPQPESPRAPLALTISREAYSGCHEIAEELIRLLQKDKRLGEHSWALFDRDLVHKVLEDHHLPKAMAKYMPEDRDHNFTGLINEILGLHPSQWELFHHTCDSILKLANIGNVIVIGRGAHIITRHLRHVVHVRVICPLEKRASRASLRMDISYEEALKTIKLDDAARAAFVKSHFDEAVNDPMAYHLILNTGKLDHLEAAQILYQTLRTR
ncbi:cytidylate kinase-like family protein [Puniceicoccales bacterium CK1056]|uniref:Cytidylate kinase-like family protein n=1 Tax=Oceanipulchritudo coccoides TaxID=2706888 RepID=A0A6B2LXW7_9BACT|nr:cytidylate kinase-like family protein [Oceanipulchritudo coccoides]NDV60952.1 cytidylate kinase-like family protein [Oceanipulchritudo coccoides]